MPEKSLMIGFDGKLSSRVLMLSKCDVIFTGVPFVHALAILSHTLVAIWPEVCVVRQVKIDAF
ncbi:hypothetical protein D3C84_1225770 [compost metagenome]